MAMLTIWQLSSKTVSKDLQEWFADWLKNPTSSTTYGPNFISTVHGWDVKDAQWAAILDELTSPDDIETFINIYFMCRYKEWGFDKYEGCYKSIKNAREAIVKICMEVGFGWRQNPFRGFFENFGGKSGVEFTFKNIAELNNALIDRSIEWAELSGILKSVSVLFCKDFYKKSNLDQYLKEWDNINARNLRIGNDESKSDIEDRLKGINVNVPPQLAGDSDKGGVNDNFLKVAMFTGQYKEKIYTNDKIKDLAEIMGLEEEFKASANIPFSNKSHEELIRTDKADKEIQSGIDEIDWILKKAGITPDQQFNQKLRDYTSYQSHKNNYKFEKLEKKNNGK